MPRRISHVIGVDDAPFARSHKGDVTVVGAVFAGDRLDGVLTGKVRKDGANATQVLTQMVSGSRFVAHLQAVMLQGIALGGFNVVDIRALSEALGLPVLVVMRKAPDFAAIQNALLSRVPGGARKWRLIQAAGEPQKVGNVLVQWAGMTADEAKELITRTTAHSDVPEPIRTAHLIAGGLMGESRGRV